MRRVTSTKPLCIQVSFVRLLFEVRNSRNPFHGRDIARFPISN